MVTTVHRYKTTDILLNAVTQLAALVMLASLLFGLTGLGVGLYVIVREYVPWW